MFNLYPRINYKVDSYDTIKCIDINVSAKIKDAFAKYNSTSTRPYRIIDGEPPDMVSYKFYGTPKYAHIIMMTNNIYSLYDDWPKTTIAFKKYIIEKYGSIYNAVNTDLYFYTGEKLIISQESYLELTDTKKYKETALEYEQRRNSEKSRINILEYKYALRYESGLRDIFDGVAQ